MGWVADIWSVLTARQRRWALGAQLLSIVMALSTVAGIASIAPFFSVLGNPHLVDEPGIFRDLYAWGFASHRSFTLALGLAFVSLVLLANLINLVGSVILIRIALWIGTDLQSVLFAEYLHRPYLFHARTSSAVVFNNVIHETTRATNHLLQNAFALVTSLVTAALIIVSVMLLNPLVAGIMIAALAGGYALIYLAVRNRLLRAGEIQSRYFIEQTQVVNESLAAVKEILVRRTQALFRRRFERAGGAFARAAAHTQLIAQSPRYLMECVAVIGLVGAALAAGGSDDGLSPWLGKLTFLGFAAYRLLPTLQQAFMSIVKIRADRAGFALIAPDLRLGRMRRDPNRQPDPRWRGSPRSEIRLRQVSFRYEPGQSLSVDGATLCIPAGAAVGLIGANGSGKTTLVDLIAGLLAPESGSIEVDGVVLEEDNRAGWQSRIAYVPQAVCLLDSSIAENIALGTPPSEIDRSRLIAAAELAQLDAWVATLPAGYEHQVGERGVRSSGGQRQRVGIARALYTDAAVLILDEATNALDGLTEQELVSTIANLRGRRTIVLIAHRLSTLRGCDLIFEIERGRVVGGGTYDELLAKSASFRRLASIR